MKVKIFRAFNTKHEVEEMEKEINEFLNEGDSEITETYFRVENDTLFYFVEYDE